MPDEKQPDAPDASTKEGAPKAALSRGGRAPKAPEGNGGAPKPKIGDTRPAPKAGPKAAPEASDSSSDGGNGAPRSGSRRRGRRGGRGRSRSGGGAGRTTPAAERTESGDAPTRAAAPAEGAAPTRAPRPPRPRQARPRQDEGRAVEDDAAEESATAAPGRGRRRRGRRGASTAEKVRYTGRYLMCVHVKPGIATHVALLEGRALVEHYVSRPQDDTAHIYGNIYWGKVQNVLPGMEAAFVDIATPKNGVLYRGDVTYEESEFEGGRPRIERMLKNGQMVMVQVTKNPIGSKGARLTQEISLPGRYVVMVPDQPDTYGISKRLPDEERKRLRQILDDIRPRDAGLIVRTAAEGATGEELERDLHRLKSQWGAIKTKAKGRSAMILHQEPDLALRIIREEFNREYRGVLIDDRDLYEQVRSYVEDVSPDLADRLEMYEGEDLPLFERFHVQEQLQKALDRKVWLPSGGSLVIEQTEALTVIDVNTSKNVGKSNLEETVYQNNLEAAEEIARQLRLRDIGGIIVVDFIDMEIEKNRVDVLRKFKDALARDKTRTQVWAISELGLVEMTRKRVAEDLVESFSETCPTCNGRGLVLEEELL